MRFVKTLGRVSLFLAALIVSSVAATAAEPETVRVMSFNIWVGGESGMQPLAQTAKVIEAAGADIVGMQETRGAERDDGTRPDNSIEIAKQLGWHHFDQGDGTAILSRYPIVETTPNKWGGRLELPSGRSVWLFNVHHPASPYQPYQLLNIPYGDAPFLTTEDEAIEAAKSARGRQNASMLKEIAGLKTQDAPIFVTGDFNEPSSLDWTEGAHAAKLCPICVKWPNAADVLSAGFVDTYREAHPDVPKKPGFTWTPTTTVTDPKDHHDRIDFVYARGKGVQVTSSQVVGEGEESADIVVAPYPSDHRAVVSTIVLE
jgi:exodeoxyribonuclease-3